MGRAKKLKALRRSLRENTDEAVLMEGKQHIVENHGTHMTKMTVRHKPTSRKGLYKQIKKQGDYGED
ncbi:MAG: hypothetical protein KAS93_06645 [Gammaproteobacteria bacterium]|nr:hypothetical protein [Gammaproteobacteria bacterium]